MTEQGKEKVINLIADYFRLKPDNDGKHDIDSYTWTGGCYVGNMDDLQWLSLSKIIEIIEYFEYELYDILSEEDDF